MIPNEDETRSQNVTWVVFDNHDGGITSWLCQQWPKTLILI